MHPLLLPHHVPIAVTYRGGHPENIHHGSVAVVDAQGRLIASAGDVTSPMFTRSCLKPFQALPLIAQWADRYRLEEADLALLCASHNGEPMHAERVATLLSRFGAKESDLTCGVHTPYFFGATGQTPVPGAHFTALQHNCSGKHCGMLMLAHALGAPLAGYLGVEHPVQQQIVQSVSHFSGGRNDLTLMSAGGGDWVSKVGADGVQVLASFSRGVAIAAKCSDGMLTPLLVAFVSVLEQLGWLNDGRRATLSSLTPPALKNSAGMEVGEMRPVVTLRFAN
jgi:L-asparaginase II